MGSKDNSFQKQTARTEELVVKKTAKHRLETSSVKKDHKNSSLDLKPEVDEKAKEREIVLGKISSRSNQIT